MSVFSGEGIGGRVLVAAAVVTIGAEALAGCSGGASPLDDFSQPQKFVNGGVFVGANVRTGPIVAHDSETNASDANVCFKGTKEAEFFGPTTVYLAQGDANGPWLGIPLAAMPKAVQEKCRKSPHHVVWIIQQAVLANAKKP